MSFIIISTFPFHAPCAWATNYYIDPLVATSTGVGTIGDPFKLIAQANALTPSNGDALYLKRDHVYNDACLGGTDGKSFFKADNLTVGAYGTGAKPILDGNVNRCLYAYPTATISNLTIQDIDISGQNWTEDKNYNLYVRNVNGVTIDGVYGNGFYGSGHHGKNPLGVGYCQGVVEIKNCEIFNYGPETIPTLGESDNVGILVSYQSSGSILVHDNISHNINSDCFQLYRCTAPALIYSNTFYNGGENAVDHKESTNAEYYDNLMHRDPDFTGGGGSSGVGALIVVHDPDNFLDGIGGDVSIHDNVLNMGNHIYAISVFGYDATHYYTDIDIYGNLITSVTNGLPGCALDIDNAVDVNISYNGIYGTAGVLKVGSPVSDLIFEGNGVYDPVLATIATTGDAGGIYENNTGISTYINNTFYNKSGTSPNIFYIANSGGSIIRDNIGYQGSAVTGTPYVLNVRNAGTAATVDHNNWYDENGTRIYYRGTEYSGETLATYLSAHDGDQSEDPLFSPGGLYLRFTSPAKSASSTGSYIGAFPTQPSLTGSMTGVCQ